jgi:parallel beta-helix repeat protein
MKRIHLILSILIITVFFIFMIIPSYGVNLVKINNTIIIGETILYVGGSGPNNYTTIQSAIANANPGGTIFVYDDSSPYNEHILIHKSLNLVGEDKNTTIIQYPEGDEIVYINADNVTIRGFTIQNSGKRDYNLDGIVFKIFTYNCTIVGNILKNNYIGIDADTCKNTLIKNNKIIHNIIGIYFFDIFNLGINNHITGNFIAHNHWKGIADGDRDYGTIATWNVIADNGKIKQYPIYSGGIIVQDSYSIYHHNDFLFNNINAYAFGRYGNYWDDSSKGNYWDDWKDNPGYPDKYIIESQFSWEVDYYPSSTMYSNHPVVGISKGHYYALIDEPIEFYANSSVDPYSVSWLWEFGDGNTSDEISPTYSYSSTGHYYVNATISDINGRSDTSKANVYIGRPPENTTIKGPKRFILRFVRYTYKISADDPDGDDIYYYIDWGDWYDTSIIVGPYPSGKTVEVSNIWYEPCTGLISVIPYDTADLEGEEAQLEIFFGRNHEYSNFNFFKLLLDRFPLRERLLGLIK